MKLTKLLLFLPLFVLSFQPIIGGPTMGKCPLCGEYDDMYVHKRSCPKISEKCLDCGERQYNLKEHKEQGCNPISKEKLNFYMEQFSE